MKNNAILILGNWGDDFPAAEDWDNDEYTGSLSDSKVGLVHSQVHRRVHNITFNGLCSSFSCT